MPGPGPVEALNDRELSLDCPALMSPGVPEPRPVDALLFWAEIARRHVYSGLGCRSALVAGMPKIVQNRSVGWASKLNPPMWAILSTYIAFSDFL